jgi:threo-3-hydroxy-L-aspartate ammonia-lyase
MTTLIDLDDIRAAAERIRLVAFRTPLLPVPVGSPIGVGQLLLKCENLQRGGAFKIRGAYNMMAQLTPDERGRGVVTFSSGNHGLAMAIAARLLDTRATIVMPTTASPVKVAIARDLGAEVIFEGTTSLDRKARAEAEANARGLTMMPPFEQERIIAGQGTVGLEILESCPEVDRIYVPMGGGGLISGVATVFKTLRPSTRIVGVEPVGAPKMTMSLAAGHPVTLAKTGSVADGLMTSRPGDITFAHVQARVDECVTIEDAAILDAVRWLFRNARLVVEPSGAITVAAALAHGAGAIATGERVVAVLSGGNVEAGLFAKIIADDIPG